MPDDMRAVLDVRPEMRSKEYADDKKFNMQAKRAEEATEASRKVYEKLEKQMDLRRLRLS